MKVILVYFVYETVFMTTGRIVFQNGADQYAFLTVISYISCGILYSYLGIKFCKEVKRKSYKTYEYIPIAVIGFLVGITYMALPLHEIPIYYLDLLLDKVLKLSAVMPFEGSYNYGALHTLFGVMLTGLIVYECLLTYYKKKHK